MQYNESARIKHLELAQSVVARQASNSFLIKGWTITVSSAIYAISIQQNEVLYALLGSGVVASFWSLDSYYLRNERLFRRLYQAIRREEPTVEAFSLDPAPFSNYVESTFRVALTASQLRLHGPLLAIGLVLAAVFCWR